MTHQQARREAAGAQTMAMQASLQGCGKPWPVSARVGWAELTQRDAADLAAAGIGQPACAPN